MSTTASTYLKARLILSCLLPPLLPVKNPGVVASSLSLEEDVSVKCSILEELITRLAISLDSFLYSKARRHLSCTALRLIFLIKTAMSWSFSAFSVPYLYLTKNRLKSLVQQRHPAKSLKNEGTKNRVRYRKSSLILCLTSWDYSLVRF